MMAMVDEYIASNAATKREYNSKIKPRGKEATNNARDGLQLNSCMS